MKRIWVLLFSLPLFGQAPVPNRYIVELSEEPVAAHAGARAGALHTAAAESQRGRIRTQQAAVRAAIELRQGVVIGRVENVSNALIVQISDTGAAGLSTIAGVVRVHPERRFHMLLDHALVLHRAIDAWNQVGANNAGAGVKIAMIDTGIDVGHPGFSDASFSAPAGFPVADSMADLAYTNNKVIVARSYASLFASPDPDPSAADHVGHGTATAMAAAGVMNAGPLATIGGIAPRAYLGSYKVFGTPGVNDYASEGAILQAIEDAVTDGMDVISMSLGSDVAERLEYDPEVQALELAVASGVIVVASAGNNGSDPETIGSPADAPSVIAVGASANDRMFAGTVLLPGGQTLVAIPAAEANSATPIVAMLVDVATLDGSGLACSPLPANSLSGSIAFIFRGTCTFESKLDNAQAGGAIGALVYDSVPGEAPITMGVGAASLPAEMVSNSDGLALRAQLAAGVTATLQFALSPAYVNPANIASFSAQGPNVDSGIKPDMLAVGLNLYTAAQKLDPNGELYDPSGYAVEQGTSFSAPLVAGAAALLKQALPGLTVDDYRSLLIDVAAPGWLVPGTAATVQQAGGGVLDVLASLNATAAAAPVSLSFGASGAPAAQNITITNVGTVSDTFQLSVVPRISGAPVPQLPAASVQLDPGASVSIPVQFQAGSLAPGAYDGFINIQGALSAFASHVPYWYGVPSNQPAHVTVLYNAGSSGPQAAGSRLSQAVIFRVTDAAGLPVTSVVPSVTAVSTGAQASSITSLDDQVPNAYTFTARLSLQPGSNVFQIQAGSVSTTVTIVGQ
jgi:minor extracellular serine protease Vpr